MQIKIIGGWMETEVNELTVSPWGVPSGARTVATATPVANIEQAFRKASALKSGAGPLRELEAGLDKAITLILS
jgi:hypothetical protein